MSPLVWKHTATQCNTLQKTALQHTATQCNKLLHATPHCITLQHTATQCNTLHHTAPHCNNTLQHTATYYNTPQHTATHCNTLQHTTPHCNALTGIWSVGQNLLECVMSHICMDHARHLYAALLHIWLSHVTISYTRPIWNRTSNKRDSVLHYVAVCCSVLQPIAVCCSVLLYESNKRDVSF